MIVGSNALFFGEFICFIIATYVSVCLYFPDDNVLLGGFDGGYSVCGKEFVRSQPNLPTFIVSCSPVD